MRLLYNNTVQTSFYNGEGHLGQLSKHGVKLRLILLEVAEDKLRKSNIVRGVTFGIEAELSKERMKHLKRNQSFLRYRLRELEKAQKPTIASILNS
jgi:hypothetical protein